MTEETKYKETIQKGIPLIQEWSAHQSQQVKETEDFKEVQRVIQEIENEHDFTYEAYEDIRFILRPFEETLPLKIKRIFNISTMDQYTMFIASRWFNSIEDHINLVLGVKRFNQNMTKFHYNGISVNNKSIEWFPNVETLHLYEEGDEYIEGGRIERYVDWNRISYYETEEMKTKNEGKEIEFKRIVWTRDDTKKQFNKEFC